MDDYDRLLTFYATSFESPPGPTLQVGRAVFCVAFVVLVGGARMAG
jgi:hypothetical protein